MWLRDALPHDLPCARVLTYGYDTRLAGSHSFENLEDVALKFRRSLKVALGDRPSDRPLIFIAHSLGGLVLKQALITMASGSMEDVSIFHSTYGILFFGVPNQGMDTSSLLAMVGSQPNFPFLILLSKDAGVLQEIIERFRTVFKFKDSDIISLYETHTSRTARKDATGKWSMSGDHAVLVDRFSARSGRSWEENHSFLQPISRNHSDMVKYSEYDDDIGIVCEFLIRFAKEAPAVIKDRLKSLNTSLHLPPRSILSSANKPELVGRVEVEERRPRTGNEPRHERLNFVRDHRRPTPLRRLTEREKWDRQRAQVTEQQRLLHPIPHSEREMWDRQRAREMEQQRLMNPILHPQLQGFNGPLAPRMVPMQNSFQPDHHGHHDHPLAFNSFKIPDDAKNSFPRTAYLHSQSSENINTKFSPDNWHGPFFEPPPPSRSNTPRDVSPTKPNKFQQQQERDFRQTSTNEETMQRGSSHASHQPGMNQDGYYGHQPQPDRHSHHSDDDIVTIEDFGQHYHHHRPQKIYLKPPKSHLPKGLKAHEKPETSAGKQSKEKEGSDDESQEGDSKTVIEKQRRHRSSKPGISENEDCLKTLTSEGFDIDNSSSRYHGILG